MIEKKIHYCWFGKNKKSELIKRCISSWKRMCPDYEIIEWNEDNYDITKNEYMYEAYKAKKWAFVSDYARLDIVFNNGGIYLDTDVELLQPLDDIIDKVDAFFCFENMRINTGLGFGAVRENTIVKELLDSYSKIHFIKEDGSYDMTACPKRNETIFYKVIGDNNISEKIVINKVAFYPKEYFCPYDYETKILNKTSKTIAIHWYGESWLSSSKKILNKIKIIIKRIIGINRFNNLKNKFKKRSK